jgi:hypothetical protein
MAMATSKNRYVPIISIVLLGSGALFSSALPASAASRGLTASCSFINPTRLQCNIPVLTANYNAEIHYFSVQCTSTGVAYNLQEFRILAVPPNDTSDVGYQVAGNRPSVAGVVNAAGNIGIHVKANTTSGALIDLAPAPTGTTSCTVSVSATF